ncbi:unnamed protein product [Ambrosiozyma monospora]|uniref:Unnamed protein product n=1 Tax=Ambrosiozyma monospora TaxID=43982 RepID=A0A9W7DF13_AMBMO|nr:unnamed protein product [Ambrosiozyma monospora]
MNENSQFFDAQHKRSLDPHPNNIDFDSTGKTRLMIVRDETKAQMKILDSSSGFYSYFNDALRICQNHVERGLVPVNIFAKTISDGYNFMLEYKKTDLRLNATEERLLKVYLEDMVDQDFQLTTCFRDEPVMSVLYDLASYCGFIKRSHNLYGELEYMRLRFSKPEVLEEQMKTILLKSQLSKVSIDEYTILEYVSSRCPECLVSFREFTELRNLKWMTISDYTRALEEYYTMNVSALEYVEEEELRIHQIVYGYPLDGSNAWSSDDVENGRRKFNAFDS